MENYEWKFAFEMTEETEEQQMKKKKHNKI